MSGRSSRKCGTPDRKSDPELFHSSQPGSYPGGRGGSATLFARYVVQAFLEDLKKLDVPTHILHGNDDQIVPIGASALLSPKVVKGARLKVYSGAPHGLCTTHFFKE